MMKNIIRKMSLIIAISTMLIFLLQLTSCNLILSSATDFDKDWMIGKNSKQIQARCGKFDYTSASPNEEDGLYYNCECRYYTYDGNGPFRNEVAWRKYLVLYFNEEGVVYKVKNSFFEGYIIEK